MTSFTPHTRQYPFGDRAQAVPVPRLFDETLRDGLQGASVRCPSVEEKIELLHAMAEVGVDAVNLGIPASSARASSDAVALAREAVSSRLAMTLVCAGRTVAGDIRAALGVAQAAGVALEIHAFIGSSAVRAYAEGWTIDTLVKNTHAAVHMAVREGLRVTYVTEDTTRARPETLRTLFACALDAGATGLCLADTVGHATPDGTRALVEFTRRLLADAGRDDVGIDWHGHNDRGLALVNAVTAAHAGVTRVHGTALGVGERTGNTPMERLFGLLPRKCEPSALDRYCDLASRALDQPIPIDHPLRARRAVSAGTRSSHIRRVPLMKLPKGPFALPSGAQR